MSKVLIFDTETATLPKLKELERQNIVQDISLKVPIIYDFGWNIVDMETGAMLKTESNIVMETYYNESVFNTAYYRQKRKHYDEMIDSGEIEVLRWKDVVDKLMADLEQCDYISAYNANFDYRAIDKTEKYIQQRYSHKLNSYEDFLCKLYQGQIQQKKYKKPKKDFSVINIRDKSFPVVDIWNMACTLFSQDDEYKDYCIENNFTKNKVYFPSSAEIVYSFLNNNPAYVEEHTALADSLIEKDILIACLVGIDLDIGIKPFPFRRLGKVADYIAE